MHSRPSWGWWDTTNLRDFVSINCRLMDINGYQQMSGEWFQFQEAPLSVRGRTKTSKEGSFNVPPSEHISTYLITAIDQIIHFITTLNTRFIFNFQPVMLSDIFGIKKAYQIISGLGQSVIYILFLIRFSPIILISFLNIV